MASVVLLLSDTHTDVRDLLPAFPAAPFRVVVRPLKDTAPTDLVQVHPDVVLVDGTMDLIAAEGAAKQLALAWEIGLPPVVAVLDEDGVARFRFESGADDFLVT